MQVEHDSKNYAILIDFSLIHSLFLYYFQTFSALSFQLTLFCLDEAQVRPQLIASPRTKSGGPPVKPDGYWVETLSSAPEPRISLIHNLVTPEEAKHLMFLGAIKGMQKALIIPYGQKHLTQSSTRTNSAAWLDFGTDAVVGKVEKTYAEITGLPMENGENLQVLTTAPPRPQHLHPNRPRHDPIPPPLLADTPL